MSPTIGYVAAALLPLIHVPLPNPVALHWYQEHGLEPMPSAVETKVRRAGEAIRAAQLIALMLALCLLIPYSGLSARALGATSERWRMAAAIGLLAGLCWLALYLWLLVRLRPNRQQLARNTALQHSLVFFVPLALSYAVVEEVWRSLCLVTISVNGAPRAVVVVAVASMLAHLRPLSRAVSATLFALYAASLFLWTQSLWTTAVTHSVVNIGTIWLVHSHAKANER